MKKWVSQIVAAAMLSSCFLPSGAYAESVPSLGTPAFPGAEGGGKFTTGGRAGEVYEVNTLADSGPGSLRDAVSSSNRMIVFKVGGTIHLESPLKITGSNLTIAGQTAPGEGITISDYPTTFDASNLIIRYMRFRLGDLMPTEADAFGGRYQKNIMIDHCSFSWSVDEVMSNYNNENVTVQWSIISEAMHLSRHVKGKHGYGGIWGGKNTSYHHNLIAHNSSRNPAFDSTVGNYHDFRNNVVYNWGYFSSYGGKGASTNLINNYYKPGPDTENIRFLNAETNGSYYIAGNHMEGYPSLTADNWSGVFTYPDYKMLDNSVSFDSNPITTESAVDAYPSVLAGTGAILPRRDAIDARIVNDVKNGTGRHLNSQNEVGGYPEFEKVVSELEDNDRDGMPDDWERQQGLNPNDAADGRIVTQEGYTNLELYLNSITTSGSNNPNAVITSPQNNAILPERSKVTVEVDASDSDGTVSKVEFYNNCVKLGEDLTAPYSYDWNDVPDGTHYLIAKAVDTTGTATQSTNVVIHANRMGSIAPWTAVDVGTPGIPGHTQLGETPDSITVKSAGDIEGTKDAFQFAYQQMSGDVEVVTKVESVTATDEGAEAGIMFRESLSESSPFAAIVIPYMKPGKRGVTLSRAAEGGEVAQVIPDEQFQLPYWAKLVRMGDQITSFVSPDGVNWNSVGTVQIPLPDTFYAGLVADASKANNSIEKYNTSVFSNVSVTQTSQHSPSPPANVKAVPGNKQVTLSWDVVNTAASYTVKASQFPAGPYTPVASGITEPSYTHPDLKPGTLYYYIITAVNANGESLPSTEVSAVPTAAPGTVYYVNDDYENISIGSMPEGYVVSPNPQDANHTVTVQEQPAGTTGNPSSKVLKIYDNAPGSTQLVRNFSKQMSTVVFELDYMSPSHPGTSIVLQVKDGQGTKTPISIELRKPALPAAEDNYTLTYKNKNSQDVKLMDPPAVNRWYNLKVVANVAANKMDIYIDNVLAAKDVDLKDDMSTLGLGSVIVGRTPGTGKGTMYFDNFKIYVEPVASPKGLTALPGNGKVQVNWTLTQGALAYNVKRGTTSGGPYETIASGITTTSFTDSSVINNTTYYYVVTAMGESGESGSSNEVNVTPSENAVKPEAPSGLVSIARNTQADLTWVPVANATSYTLKRSELPEGPFSVVKNNVTGSSYRDTALVNGKLYYYTVSATSVSGEGENSTVISARPAAPLQAPVGLTAMAGDTQSTIKWLPSDGAQKYAVKRSAVAGGPYTLVADNLTGTSFIDGGLSNGTAYYYVVSASNNNASSANSASVRIIPIPAGSPKAPEEIQIVEGNQAVNLEWTVVPEATSYHVKRATSITGPFTTVASHLEKPAFRDTSVTNGTTYYYSISSVSSYGEGIPSFPKAATPAIVIVVAKDGSGAFTSVQAAVDSIPAGNTERKIIYVRNGTYEEQVTVPATKNAISFIGESKENTIITYTNITGTGYNERATAVESNDFIAENITFANGAGSTGVAVALDLKGDRAYLNQVRLLGYQDTLFTNATGKRLYVKDSYIEGAVDFIYGPSIAVFDNCIIHNKRTGGYVTAASTPENQKYGYLFINSKLTADPEVSNMYLGRPWRPFAHTVFMNTYMDDIIHPAGWNNWGRPDNEKTARYYEFNNFGPGADPTARANWSKQLTPEEANEYTVPLMMSGKDGWDPTMIGNRIPMDITAPLTTDDAPKNWVNHDVKVTFTLTDQGSGVAATYYRLNGGEQQEGTDVNISAEGVHTLTYWSIDKAGNAEEQQTAVIQIDKTAPALTVVMDQNVLWPANHKLVTVNTSVYAEDLLSQVDSVVLTSITSNEQREDGSGIESQEADIVGANYGTLDTEFMLRAERSGKGAGRVYTITYTATDRAGNVNSASTMVTVPHDSGGRHDD